MIASIHFSNVANFDSHYVLEPILLNGSSCCPTIKWISLIHVLGSSWVIKHLSISKLAGKHMRSSFACASASNIFVLLVEFLISEQCSVDLAYSLASRVLCGIRWILESVNVQVTNHHSTWRKDLPWFFWWIGFECTTHLNFEFGVWMSSESAISWFMNLHVLNKLQMCIQMDQFAILTSLNKINQLFL